MNRATRSSAALKASVISSTGRTSLSSCAVQLPLLSSVTENFVASSASVNSSEPSLSFVLNSTT